MSKAIKLTKTDLEYLKFGGATRFRNQLESVRIQHESLSDALLQIVPFQINTPQLFVDHDTSALTPEQVRTLNLLCGVAGETGYKIKVSSTPAGKNSGTKILLTNDSPLTFDEIFNRPFDSGRKPLYIKRKGIA